MDQYRRIKSAHRDEILFFRLGDFYEMFERDALEVSSLLNLTLTKRQDAPMCGIPYHAAHSYISRLLKAGKKIAICEQTAVAGVSRGLMDREVVEIITPGTTVEEDYLDSRSNNYLVSIGRVRDALGIAYVDVSTGEFCAFSAKQDAPARLRKELYRLAPREALVQQTLLDDPDIAQILQEREGLILNRFPDWSYDQAQASEILTKRFGTASLKGFGFSDDDPALAPAGVLVRYLEDAFRGAVPHLEGLRPRREEAFADIDESAQRNLEIDRNLQDGGRAFTLLDVLDATRTAMGARLLKHWLLRPLRDPAAIRSRLDAVERLYRNQRTLERLRSCLGNCMDLERLASRVAMDKAHAKDLLGIKGSLDTIREAAALLEPETGAAPELGLDLGPEVEEELRSVSDLVGRAILEDPSVLLNEGNLIRPGFDPELDALRDLRDSSRSVLESYLEEERTATGIQNLRIRYNRILGYYLEVTKGALPQVPSHFIRRQSLSTGERYTTDRLAELESRINGAQERIVERERERFLEVRTEVKAAVPRLLEAARACARVDCLASFAYTATARGYTRPEVDDTGTLGILEGRHPVVEAHRAGGDFVPNDVRLDSGEVSFALITGPNMAGKSTYLRQTALIVLLAQAGSFVPAGEARIGVVDRIFCRVGAQDNLARGESTFLVEMHETAYILNNAGPRSLVIMDEVGRGTGTLDGLAIAWAAAEHLLDAVGCRTLFATHYHELTALEHPKLVNRSLAVRESAGEVVFLKRVVEGPAAGSYGLHVAGLAGIPAPVLARARQVRENLARKERDLPAAVASPRQPAQAALFSNEELVLEELRSLDPDRITPLEALSRLARLKKLL